MTATRRHPSAPEAGVGGHVGLFPADALDLAPPGRLVLGADRAEQEHQLVADGRFGLLRRALPGHRHHGVQLGCDELIPGEAVMPLAIPAVSVAHQADGLDDQAPENGAVITWRWGRAVFRGALLTCSGARGRALLEGPAADPLRGVHLQNRAFPIQGRPGIGRIGCVPLARGVFEEG